MSDGHQTGAGRAPWESGDPSSGSRPGGAPADNGGDNGPTAPGGAGDPFADDAEVVDAEVVDQPGAGARRPAPVPEVDTDAPSADAASGDGTPAGEPVADPDPLSAALTQRDEYLDALRRLQAEFENYRKRVAKQQEDQVARAALSLVDTLLPVLDALDMATEHLGDAGSADGRALVAVASQLRDVLSRQGLERIDPVGAVFDPNDHEAVGHVPADDGEDAAGAGTGEPEVAQVMRAGYRWRGATVRPAMVMVRG